MKQKGSIKLFPSRLPITDDFCVSHFFNKNFQQIICLQKCANLKVYLKHREWIKFSSFLHQIYSKMMMNSMRDDQELQEINTKTTKYKVLKEGLLEIEQKNSMVILSALDIQAFIYTSNILNHNIFFSSLTSNLLKQFYADCLNYCHSQNLFSLNKNIFKKLLPSKNKKVYFIILLEFKKKLKLKLLNDIKNMLT